MRETDTAEKIVDCGPLLPASLGPRAGIGRSEAPQGEGGSLAGLGRKRSLW